MPDNLSLPEKQPQVVAFDPLTAAMAVVDTHHTISLSTFNWPLPLPSSLRIAVATCVPRAVLFFFDTPADSPSSHGSLLPPQITRKPSHVFNRTGGRPGPPPAPPEPWPAPEGQPHSRPFRLQKEPLLRLTSLTQTLTQFLFLFCPHIVRREE